MAKRKSSLRYFVLRDSKGKEFGVYTGRSPRQAALKVANRDIKDIRLRERGTKKIHIYRGTRTKISAPDDKPEWMPAEVWKPNVHKMGIEKLDRIER